MAFTIRPALRDDAAEISRVVLSALHGSNAREYGPETIARVARSFTPDGITAQIAARQVFVAMEGGASSARRAATAMSCAPSSSPPTRKSAASAGR